MIKLFLLCLALLVAVWWVGRRFGRSRPGLSTYLRTEEERNEREAAQMLRDNLHMPPGEALAPLISLARDIIPDNGPLRLDITPPQGDPLTEEGRRAVFSLRAADPANSEERHVIVVWLSGRWMLRNQEEKECSRSDLAEAAGELERLLREAADVLNSSPAEQPASRELSMSNTSLPPIVVIGGGLAGCECALSLAAAGSE